MTLPTTDFLSGFIEHSISIILAVFFLGLREHVCSKWVFSYHYQSILNVQNLYKRSELVCIIQSSNMCKVANKVLQVHIHVDIRLQRWMIFSGYIGSGHNIFCCLSKCFLMRVHLGLFTFEVTSI